ncbi:type II secretion system protein GspN [bacterium]|nr:type II secretion system protein GspN [bacterium]
MNKLVVWTLNIVAGIFFFFLFLFLYFPFEPIIQNLLTRVEQQSGGKYRITVEKIAPGIIFKTKFTNFQVHTEEKGADVVIVGFDELKVGIHYFPLLTGRLEASFVGGSKKGSLEGDITASKTESELDVKISNFPLGEMLILKKYLGTGVEGTLNGSIDLDLYADQINKNEGKIDLKIKKLTATPFKITPMPGFDLDFPDLSLADAQDVVLKMNMAKGKLEIESFKIPGPDVMLDLKGRLMLNKKPTLMRANVSGNFNFSEKVKSAFPIAVLIDKQKLEDGSYPLNISGSLSRPRVLIGTFDLTGMAGGNSGPVEEEEPLPPPTVPTKTAPPPPPEETVEKPAMPAPSFRVRNKPSNTNGEIPPPVVHEEPLEPPPTEDVPSDADAEE